MGDAGEDRSGRPPQERCGRPLGKQQLNVVGRKRIVPGEARFIDRNAEQQSPFVVRQQLSAAHGALRAGPASMARIKQIQQGLINNAGEYPNN